MSLDAPLTRLHLPRAAAALPAWLDRAAQRELGDADFLRGLLGAELVARTAAATRRRLREAGFPFAAPIEQFDSRFRPEPKRQVVLRYRDATFVEQAGPLTLIGPPGLGRTMRAICVATKQVQPGHTARFVTAQALANHLGRIGAPAGRQRLLTPLPTGDVLALDERGDPPTAPAFGPALDEIVAGRYERRPPVSTSNKSLAAWAQIVQDVSPAPALADRLLHHGQVFYLTGPSWRTKDHPAAAPLTEEAAGRVSTLLSARQPRARRQLQSPRTRCCGSSSSSCGAVSNGPAAPRPSARSSYSSQVVSALGGRHC